MTGINEWVKVTFFIIKESSYYSYYTHLKLKLSKWIIFGPEIILTRRCDNNKNS